MICKVFSIGLFLVVVNMNAQVLPKVVAGSLKRIEKFQSKYVDPRNVDIWLPEGYSPSKKYAVLYMHDGQMLFDPEMGWNKTAWNVDDVISTLVAKSEIKDVIVVGIWNGDKSRRADYFPQKAFETLSKSLQDSIYKLNDPNGNPMFSGFKICSDNYLKFIVKELKPYIDGNFSTHKNKKNTFIMGSSRGGLISIYAICEYPNVFGSAGCMSTHWPGVYTLENNPIPETFFKYLQSNLPSPKSHKIYFDYGDQTLDALYPTLQQKVDVIMKAKGFDETNWKTQFFPGANHSESAWNERLHIPILFLLGK